MEEKIEMDKVANLKELTEKYEKFMKNNRKDNGIETLITIEKLIINMREECTNEQRKTELTVMYATICLNLGCLYRDTDELEECETRLMKCMELLQEPETDMKFGRYPMIHCLLQLGIIYFKRNQYEEALKFLNKLNQIFLDYASDGDYHIFPEIPYYNFIVDNDEEKFCKDIEECHMLSLQYMAQIYCARGDYRNSSICCHKTLCKQLHLNKTTQKLDYIEWVMNASILSQYFLEIEAFNLARHHLAAASYVLETYENILKEKTKENPESEQIAADWEEFKHRSADVALCWSKYGIILLDVSKGRLLEKSELDEDNNETFEQQNKEKVSELKLIANLKFHDLEKDIERIASQVTDQYLLDFDDARPVFLNIKKWLDQAKSYYTLNEHASDHVIIAGCLAKAYYHLASFEEDEDRQAKMHKRRIDILETVTNELNPQFYKSECRQFWISIAEAYSDLLNTKLDRIEFTGVKPGAIAKINQLAQNSINNYQKFLNSLSNHSLNDPELREIPEDLLQPALFSYYNIGRLYRKLTSSDKVVQATNTENSINALKFVVTYCEKYPAAAEIMKPVLYLCKELIALLPVKLSKLRVSAMD